MTIQSKTLKLVAPILLLAVPVSLAAQQAAPDKPVAETPPPAQAEATPAPAEAAPAAPAPEAAPAVPAEPIATAAPAPQAQASYPPCSATLTDQCTSVTKRTGAKKGVRRTKRN
jgi:pyruvate dehydrogenase E2 component (dihydrolipoamide acetyltransferase)